MDRVSRDLEWLHGTLESVVHEDKFTARLLELSKRIEAEGIQQKAYLGIHRSDYMLHEPQEGVDGDMQRLLQVELNAISSSFGCISSLTSQLHQYLISSPRDAVAGVGGSLQTCRWRSSRADCPPTTASLSCQTRWLQHTSTMVIAGYVFCVSGLDDG
ncbi:hypothetical protein PINS_up013848 [Pythium insidiosum]|nr:hypothetical protein PINS_up013848 [Pythium insidiosum]